MFRACLTLCAFIMLSGCTTNSVSNKNVNTMACSEIMHEIEHLDTTVKSNTQNSELTRAADTGTSVAATGAGMAGVPYVGGVVSIGKTLFNHNKKSAAIKANKAQERLYVLNDAAYTNGCYNGF